MLYSEVGSDCDQRTASYRRALAQFFKPHGPRNFTVRFWDGSELPAENDSSQFTLVIKDPEFFNALLAARSITA